VQEFDNIYDKEITKNMLNMKYNIYHLNGKKTKKEKLVPGDLSN